MDERSVCVSNKGRAQAEQGHITNPYQKSRPDLLKLVVLQACHDLVPPDVVAPVLRQLVDSIVHDRARPEVMTLGLKTVRELCMRTPLVMTPELLQVSLSPPASAAATTLPKLRLPEHLLVPTHKRAAQNAPRVHRSFGVVVY